MPGGRDPGAEPTEHRSAAQQRGDVVSGRAQERVAAAVELRERCNRLPEEGYGRCNDRPRTQRSAKPVEHARVEERAAHERVGSADQLGYLDLRAAIEDLEPDGVADDREYPC